MRQHVCQVCVLCIFFNLTPPEALSLAATRFSKLCASCVQHLVYGRMHAPCCCPLGFQFHGVPYQQTSTLLATTVPPWCLLTLPLPLLRNCWMPLKPDPHYEHAISFFLPWSLHHSCFAVSLDYSPIQSLCRLPIVWPFVLFCPCCHASQTLLTCLLCFWRTSKIVSTSFTTIVLCCGCPFFRCWDTTE